MKAPVHIMMGSIACMLALRASNTTAQNTEFLRVTGPVPATITEFSSDGFVTWTNRPTNAIFTVQIDSDLSALPDWQDYLHVAVSTGTNIQRVIDPSPPSGMALIPGGTFTMGDNLDGDSRALPLHTVHVSPFYMDRTEVTNDRFVQVMQWACQFNLILVSSATIVNAEGPQRQLLDLDSPYCRITWDGSHFGMKATKSSGYPCVEVTWHGAAAFCHYLSQMEGLTPCYNLTDWICNWLADGYRLPTEAEWELAARGGAVGLRFPWGNTITHDWANYLSVTTAFDYDENPSNGYHQVYDDGEFPYTSPVGSFPATGFGLYDMIGNVRELCWDLYGDYSSQTQTNPTGAVGVTSRVVRGSDWNSGPDFCRNADRRTEVPTGAHMYQGFRCVRRVNP